MTVKIETLSSFMVSRLVNEHLKIIRESWAKSTLGQYFFVTQVVAETLLRKFQGNAVAADTQHIEAGSFCEKIAAAKYCFSPICPCMANRKLEKN